MPEASAIAIALQESRPWTWDRLDQRSKQHVVDWLSTFRGKRTFDNNWHWFRVTVSTFLKSVGAGHEPVDESLDRIEAFYRGDGWYSDGPDETYDYYIGWAFHFYALMWARMDGLRSDPQRAELYRGRARAFLRQYQYLFSSNGAPLYQGRSLIYRFATVAPFWAAALVEASPLAPGRTRRVSSGVLQYFLEREAVRDGTLNMGWHREFLPMAGPFLGSASPYWASKAFTGLLLPEDHPAWTDVERPLPVEEGNFCLGMPAPGFIVQGTKKDGIVRIASHRTQRPVVQGWPRRRPSGWRRLPRRVLRRNRRVELKPVVDNDVHYRKVGFSTHSAPDIGGVAEVFEFDSHVAIVSRGQVSQRRRIFPIVIEDRFAASVYTDTALTPPARVAIVSVAKAGVEFRICQARGSAGNMFVRDGGFAVASDETIRTEQGQTWAMAETAVGLRSLMVGVLGFSGAALSMLEGHNPMGLYSVTPYLMSKESDEEEVVTISAVYIGGSPLDASTVLGDIQEVAVNDGRVILDFVDTERFVVNLGMLREEYPKGVAQLVRRLGPSGAAGPGSAAVPEATSHPDHPSANPSPFE